MYCYFKKNPFASQDYVKPTTSKTQDEDNEDKEIDEFVESLKSQVEIFVNRMKSNSSRYVIPNLKNTLYLFHCKLL